MLKKVFLTISVFTIVLTNSLIGQSADSLMLLIDSTQVDASQANIYNKLSDYYLNSDFKLSVLYAQKSGLIAHQLNNKALIAKSTLNEGVGYSNLGLFRLSFDKLTQSQHLYKQLNDTAKNIECLKNIGNIFWFENNFSEALSRFRQADNLIKSSSFKEHQSAIYTNIGIAYASLNISDSVLHYLNKARYLIENNKSDFKQGMIYLNIGGYYDNINADSAIFYYKKALLYKDGLQTRLVSFLNSSIAQAYISKRQTKQAKRHLDSGLRYANTDHNLIALREYYKIKFAFDTTFNNRKAAIKSHISYKAIEDSIHKKSHLKKAENYHIIYELHKREGEVNQLKFDNEYYRIKAVKNQFIIILLITIIGLSILLIFIYRRLNKEKKKIIKNLNSKNEDLVNHKEELSTLNEEIIVQREELYQKNKILQKTIQQVHDAQVQIIQSEKLATIGLLASGVAHEINNPLNFISAGLQQITELRNKNKLSKHQQDILTQSSKFIEDGILRASKITEALGAINQPIKAEKSRVDINNIIRNTLKLISYKITDDIELVENYGAFESVLSFPDKIQSIIIHLIANAVEAVEVHQSEPVKFLKISTWSINEYEEEKVCILIENSGENLSKTELQKIFDPFYTTKENINDVGLGLFIVYNLVKELGGVIHVENTNIGISFKIQIPIQ